jgi:uncharacterized membrane protein YecN with MAPEG domain
MTAPTITALYGALNAILNIYLANNVSNVRRKEGIGIGHGESQALLLAARVHGNNAEFVPLAILLMLIAELLGGGSLYLHLYGGMLFAARLLHAFGLPRKSPNPFRFAGTAITWTSIVVISGWILFLRTTV